MPIEFTFTSETNSKGAVVHSAQVKGSTDAPFVVGTQVKYGGLVGLKYSGNKSDATYNYVDHQAKHGFWAVFIYPTAMAESAGKYVVLNSYDRAFFTYTFMQFAAHVPNGDFVRYFRKLLGLPKAQDYFPKLSVKDGRIFFRDSDGSMTQLEDSNSTQKLMEYLNPTTAAVERQELVSAARMIHWTRNGADHRDLQVSEAVNQFKLNMPSYSKRYKLDGAPAKVCQVVCDIRHQGRAKSSVIEAALATNGDWNKAYTNLLAIGKDSYPARIQTVGSTIADLEQKGLMARKWSDAKSDFV